MAINISSVFDRRMAGMLEEIGKTGRAAMRAQDASGQGAGEGAGQGPGQAMEGDWAQGVSSVQIAKNSLNGGEISAWMGARFDQTRYMSGCHRLLNMVPLPCGGITKRPGLGFMGVSAAAEAGRAARLLPFVFSATDAAMLEFYERQDGAVGMRAWRDGVVSGELLTLPWQGAWLAEMSFCQSADVIFCAHHRIRPCKIMRYGDEDYRFAEIRWLPEIAAPRISDYVLDGAPWDDSKWTQYSYRATAIDPETGEESLPGNILTVTQKSLTSTCTVTVYVDAIPDVEEYRIYKKEGGVFGFIGRIMEEDEDGRLSFKDDNIAPDTEDTPPSYRDPFEKEGDYPSFCFLHQQRLGFGASDNKPLTLWMSSSGNYENMAASLPPADDDAIEATLAANQANRLLWAQSDRQGLTIGTSGGEWLLCGQESGAITPKNLSFQPQTSYGSQPFMPVLQAGSALLFLQRGGSVLRDLAYSYSDDRYQSTDLSILARHILDQNPVISWAYQPEPYGIVWCALKDGSMAGLTYLREHEIAAWHRHSTDGIVEQLAALPAADGSWQIWAQVIRNVNGAPRRHIETLNPFTHGLAENLDEDLDEDIEAAPTLTDILSGASPLPPPADLPRHVDGLAKSTYPCRCVPCIGVINSDNATSFLKVAKINAIKCRVVNSMPFKARVKSQGHKPSRLMNVPPHNGGFASEADWACPIAAGFRDNARLELVCDGPDPLTILGLTISLELASQSGGQG